MLVTSCFAKCLYEWSVCSDNERGYSNIVATVINHGHLALKIIDVALEGLSWLHLDCEEVVVVPLALLPRGVLVEEDVANLLKDSERPQWEGIKPVQGRALETERKTRHMRWSSWEWTTILT